MEGGPGRTAQANDSYKERGCILHADFDTPLLIDRPNDLQLKTFGGKTIEDGVKGKAFYLEKQAYLALDAKKILPESERTIMMWVRPHWGYYDAVEEIIPVSHTLMSFRWDDGGYFVLTDGWWEIKGAPYTWGVLDNQQHLHTHAKIRYQKGVWIHLACAYKFGAAGFVKLFRNGELVGEKRQFFSRIPKPVGNFFLGTDRGTDLSKDRWLDADIDEFAIFDRALDEKDILAVCKAQAPDCEEKFNRWAGDPAHRAYTPRRGKDNVIRETRAIFDEGTGWMTPSSMKETLTKIKKAGFNVYIPCVWHGKGTRYPSALAPPEDGLPLSKEDPLTRLIASAHDMGIEVHPWFCVALRQRSFLDEYYTFQTPSSAFDLHRPGFREFITELMLDVVRRYEVDGINLDYIRTMGFCTCSHCKKEYNARFNRDLSADIAIKPGNGRLATYLQSWQDDAVADVVKTVSQKGKAIRPGLVVSVDGHPRPRILPPSWEGRREIKWAKEGYIDILYNMDYEKKPDIEKHDLILEELGGDACLIMLVSNYDIISKRNISRKPDDLNDLIHHIQKKYQAGVGVYIYSMLNSLQVKRLESGCFQETAVPCTVK